MISSFFLILKAFVLTIAVILVMQIQVGQTTIERKSEAWLRTSPFVSQLQQVADGGMIVLDKLLGSIHQTLDRSESKSSNSFAQDVEPGKRHLRMKLERSKEYLKEKTAAAKSYVKKNVEQIESDYLAEEYELEEE